MAEKNLCRVCGEDFYRVEMFDRHRADYKIVRQHTTKVCYDSIKSGTHAQGECQVLIGDCIKPQDLGYVARGGVWYDSEGIKTWDKLKMARESRTKEK